MSTKEKVLLMLIENQDQFVSGEKIATELEISRNSIWKAINKLKDDGYNIISISNKGYSLSLSSDTLSKEGLLSLVKNRNDFEVELFDTIDSTNTYLKNKLQKTNDKKQLVISKHQSSGKGRLGRSFYSPSDSGLYFSLGFIPSIDFTDISLVTSIAAVALCKAIDDVLFIKCSIKWVNDLIYKSKKVSGILTEASLSIENSMIENIVIGVGVNLYQPSLGFPSDIASKAGWLLESEYINCKNKLVASFINHFFEFYNNYDQKNIMNNYRSRSLVLNKNVSITYNNSKIKGKVIDITDKNELVLLKEDNEILHINSGEVTLEEFYHENNRFM